MKHILATEKTLISLWSTKKPISPAYRFSRFLLNAESPEGILLCNTVTGELILLSEEEYEAVRENRCAEKELVQTLFARRFLVPVDFDEEKELESLRKILTLTPHPQRITSYNILTTTYCNARCFYCYESDFRHVHMSEETADEVVRFIREHHEGEKVHLAWFGGEPLVGVSAIDRIVDGLNGAEIPFHSSMTSNGYLFTEELVKRAKEVWMLDSIQITLDGTEEVYNRVKSYVGVQGSPYERVLRNIGLLLDADIHVDVRLNLDKHNADDLLTLLEDLRERFSGRKGINVYCAVLLSGWGFDPLEHTDEDYELLKARKDEIARQIVAYKLRDREGLQTLPVLKFRRCLADNPNCVQITPDGKLSKCEHYVFEHMVGDLAQGITDRQELKAWTTRVTPPFCKGCPLIPECVYPQFCPTQESVCFPFERENRINGYRAVMLQRYEKWKEEEDTP